MPRSPDPVGEYLRDIGKALARGDATEHTHRPALKTLIEELGGAGVVATNEPRRVACGAPDFIVTRRKTPLGYIETKDVDAELSKIAKGEQLKRYFGLGNLILTDYLEFRWYIDGEERLVARNHVSLKFS